MKYTSEMITRKLRDYPRLKRAKRQLEFELSLSDSNIISSMALPSPREYLEGVGSGSDKTANTALNYHDEAAAQIGISESTLKRSRQQAIVTLAEMHDLTVK
ncbi:hypothetical protein FACS1894208_01640 [Clostridia bacterium]|nr:hypothetical protein FACS1894208_01640 [Clostridia bacterium]